MKRYILLALGFILFSCDPESPIDCCTNVDTAIFIHYQNELGEDLIDSDENHGQDQIRIYFKEGNEFVYAYDNQLDSPNHYEVIDMDDQLLLRLFPSDQYEGNFSTTLIELNETKIDTVLAEFEFVNGVQCKKVWVNGIEMDGRNFSLIR